MSYTESVIQGFIVRDSDGLVIPTNEANRDYRAALKWVDDGGTIAPYAQPLAEAKAEYSTRLDADAETIRLKYLTPGDGMAMVYREKFDQAESVNALGQAAADAMTFEEYTTAYPVLAASVGVEAVTLWDCAQLVIGKYVQFNALANVIERTRLVGKKAINEAADVSGVKAAYEAVTWTV